MLMQPYERQEFYAIAKAGFVRPNLSAFIQAYLLSACMWSTTRRQIMIGVINGSPRVASAMGFT
jgi:hypothetical protein